MQQELKEGDQDAGIKHSCKDLCFLSVFRELTFWSMIFIFKVSYFLVHAKDSWTATPAAAGRHFLQPPSVHQVITKIQGCREN